MPMSLTKTETSVTTSFTKYTVDPPPVPGQEIFVIVHDDGRMQVTLNDQSAGSFTWTGVLVAAPLIRDLLSAVIADQLGT